MPSTPAPRTLADQLRGWPDARLAALLSARPDLANPAPQDSSQLASRARTRDASAKHSVPNGQRWAPTHSRAGIDT